MALSASTIFEVRTDGSDTNGGGYSSGGKDYSQQAAAQLSVTDAACTGNTTLTSATGGFTAAMIGNVVYLSSGPGWYQITARTDTNTVTIDRNGPNATGMTCNVGGALASPGGLGRVLNAHGEANQAAYIKSGTYNLSSTTANISGGVLDLTSGMNAKSVYIKGYQTARTDLTGTRPIIKANGNAPAAMMNIGCTSAAAHTLVNVEIDGESLAVNGIAGTAYYSTIAYCLVNDCDGTYAFGSSEALGCKAYSCAANGFNSLIAVQCIADSCETGFTSYAFQCVAYNCSSYGFNAQSGLSNKCVSYNCADGFYTSLSHRAQRLVDCVSWTDNGYSFRGMARSVLLNCADGGATTGRTNETPLVDIGAITLTADPFVNAASGDFSLNATAGGGALLRAAGWDSYWLGGYSDVGALQHEDSGGGGSGEAYG